MGLVSVPFLIWHLLLIFMKNLFIPVWSITIPVVNYTLKRHWHQKRNQWSISWKIIVTAHHKLHWSTGGWGYDELLGIIYYCKYQLIFINMPFFSIFKLMIFPLINFKCTLSQGARSGEHGGALSTMIHFFAKNCSLDYALCLVHNHSCCSTNLVYSSSLFRLVIIWFWGVHSKSF